MSRVPARKYSTLLDDLSPGKERRDSTSTLSKSRQRLVSENAASENSLADAIQLNEDQEQLK